MLVLLTIAVDIAASVHNPRFWFSTFLAPLICPGWLAWKLCQLMKASTFAQTSFNKYNEEGSSGRCRLWRNCQIEIWSSCKMLLGLRRKTNQDKAEVKGTTKTGWSSTQVFMTQVAKEEVGVRARSFGCCKGKLTGHLLLVLLFVLWWACNDYQHQSCFVLFEMKFMTNCPKWKSTTCTLQFQ